MMHLDSVRVVSIIDHPAVYRAHLLTIMKRDLIWER